MAEGDTEFEKELLQAIYVSIQDLKAKYIEGLTTQNEEILQQARHKIKPTLSLFELRKLSALLVEGKTAVDSSGFTSLNNHVGRFQEAADSLLSDLEEVIK